MAETYSNIRQTVRKHNIRERAFHDEMISEPKYVLLVQSSLFFFNFRNLFLSVSRPTLDGLQCWNCFTDDDECEENDRKSVLLLNKMAFKALVFNAKIFNKTIATTCVNDPVSRLIFSF